MKTIKLHISDMSCASCVNNIETTLNKKEAIKTITINLLNDLGVVTYDEEKTTPLEIIDWIKDTGYHAKVIDQKETKKTYLVEGMHCASCANIIETALSHMEGIKTVSVNLASDKVTFTYDSDLVKLREVQSLVDDIGYKLIEEEAQVDDDEVKMQIAFKRVKYSAIIAALMMSLMLIHMFVIEIPFYTVITAILAIPVVFVLGRHVHIAAYKSLKNKKPNMDVLVSMGSLPPYLIGLMALFFPITTFIEMATMIMTFHLIGKYLETRAKGKASQAIKKLIELGAKTARILKDGEEIEVETQDLSVGDIMVIRPGEKIPTDGKIVKGSTLIDESIATGESMPVKRKLDDPVIGATINKQGLIHVEVTKTGNDTFLAQVIELVEACQGTKVPIQAFADKVTGYFVPAVMAITVLTFTSFMIFTDFHRSILARVESFLPWVNSDLNPLTLAFITATAVLVIACPCALGLGTPTALMVGSGKGASNGILIRNGEAVQTLKDIQAIAFDKTGTLTYGKPQVTDIVEASLKEEAIIKLAASLEQGSEHPLAKAIIQKAKDQTIKLDMLDQFEAITGFGLKGVIKEDTYYLGSPKLMKEQSISLDKYQNTIDKLEKEAKTVMVLSSQAKVLGIIAVADALKANAKTVLKALENQGIKTIMITGDNEQTARAIADKAGISEVIANVLPDGKVNQVKSLQERYGIVAMVGDGINDAPALKQANVGIALGTGTDIAIEAADVTLVKGNLETLYASIILSQAIFRKIKENYFWAWFYNAIAIPFAMFGLLHPMIGAAAMSLSSLNVIYNSLRLKKINLQNPLGEAYEA
jgi:Cu+-exporting ATPase